MSQFHRDAPTGDIHQIHQWTYADSTARTAATGFASSDVGKVALQESDTTFWILTDDSPITWMQIGNAADIGTHTSDTSGAHAASAISFTPAGSIASTDVQTAVAEIDSDLTTLNAGVVAHAAQTTGMHGIADSALLVTLAGAQTLTNKIYNGGTASSTRQMILPKAAKATLDALARAEATLVYASDDDLVYADNGITLLPLVDGSTAQTLTNKTIAAGSNTITGLANANIDAAAAIARSKLATGTAYGAVVNDSSGALTSVAPGTSGNVLKSNGTSWESGAAPAAGALAIVSKTAAYTATGSDDVILCDATSAAFTITLPAAASNTGKRLIIKKTDSSVNAVTVDGNSSETIDGTTTKKLATQHEAISIVSDGTSWVIDNREIPSVDTSYTLTISAVTTPPTLGTTVSNKAAWSRRGDKMRISYLLYQNGVGTAGSGTYLFPIPSGRTIDGTNITISTTSAIASRLGDATVDHNGTIHADGFVYAYNSTHLALKVGTEATALTDVGSAYAALNAALVYSFTAEFPIVGWEG